jgi:hypothetical protein
MKLLKVFLSLSMSVFSALAALALTLLVLEGEWQGNYFTAFLLTAVSIVSAKWFFHVMIQTLYAIQREND